MYSPSDFLKQRPKKRVLFCYRKCGCTLSGIREGVRADIITVSILEGGLEMRMTQAGYEAFTIVQLLFIERSKMPDTVLLWRKLLIALKGLRKVRLR